MDSSTLLYLAVFFFILGAGIIGLVWVLAALFRSVSRKGKDGSSPDPNTEMLARLMRDKSNQELVVDMDGKTYKSVGELTPAQLRRLGIVSTVLAKWLQSPASAGSTVMPDQPTPAEAPVPVPQPEASITPPPASQAQTVEAVAAATAPAAPSAATPAGMSDWVPAEAAAVAAIDHHTPPFTSETEAEVKPVSTQVPDVVSGMLNPAPAPAPAFKSIAMQINDLLQEKISDTQFEKRGISVSDGPDHGVLVTLDGKKYSGVKEVPDEEVRSLIRSAVLDWEKHNKATSK